MSKPRPPRVLVVGQQLLDILRRTVTKIKIWDANGTPWMADGEKKLLTSQEAILIVAKGEFGQFVGETNNKYKRIYFLREFKVDLRPGYLWIPNPEFWDERAILRYAPDRRNVPVKVKNKEVLDMWERMLKASPAPKSWKR